MAATPVPITGANTIVGYTVDTPFNITDNFTFSFPYLDQADFEIEVNSETVLDAADFEFATDYLINLTTVGRDKLDALYTTGSVTLVIRRRTQLTTRLVDFQDGATLTEAELDLNANQGFYLIQEVYDSANLSPSFNPVDGSLDMAGVEIIDVAEPTNLTSVATLTTVLANVITPLYTTGEKYRSGRMVFNGAGDLIRANKDILDGAAFSAPAVLVGADWDDVLTAAQVTQIATSTQDLIDHEAATVVHGLSGNVVGDTDTQTLTNKTLTAPVVNSPTGIVKADVGLTNVDDTSDATKDAATATLTNKTLTSPVINSPTGIVKGDVGLGNVDNTSDATKDAATATLTNKTLTAPVINSPTGIVKADVGLTNVDDTSDATKNAATATLTNKTFDDDIVMQEIATPSTPASGYKAIYPKTDGKLYTLDDTGTEAEIGAGGGGGAGDATTIHLIKSATDSDTAFTIKSIDEVLPDFDATDTLGATFSVPSTGSEALLSNDDDHKVYKFATTTATQYDAVGRSFTMPRYARGRDILLEFQYRTADTSGASANGDYMVWIVDDTNMVNTTTTSTGAQAAGTSLTIGTSTGMSVGQKIWVGETGGTTQVTEAHITAIADSTHVTLSEAVNLTSGDRFVTGVLSDVLTTLNAADSDTDLEGASFKKYVQVPTTCASIKFLVQQLTTETDSFLYFDNILIDSDPFKKVETQGLTRGYLVTEDGSTLTDSTGHIQFSGAAAVVSDDNYTDLFTVDHSTSPSTVTFQRDCNVNISFGGLVITAQGIAGIFKNGDSRAFAMGSAGANAINARTANTINTNVIKGDYFTFSMCYIDGSTLRDVYTAASGFDVSVSITATPQKGTAIIVESAEGLAPETITYKGYTSGTATLKLKTEVVNTANKLISIDNSSYTKITALNDCHYVATGNVNASGASDWMQVFHYNSAGVQQIASYLDTTTLSDLYGMPGAISGKMSAGDYIYMGVNGGTIADASSTFLSVTATPTHEYKPLLAIPTITVGQNAEEYNAYDYAGHGSVNDRAPYFTNVSKNSISNLGTVTNDATSGFTFTATARCKITFSAYYAKASAATWFGIVKNGTLNVASTNVANDGKRLAQAVTAAADGTQTIAGSSILEAGDVIAMLSDDASGGSTSNYHVGMSLLVEPELGQQNHAAIISAPVAFVKDVRTAGTVGGAATTADWTSVRTLNTLSGDIAEVGISLSSNQFTLPAGKYEIEWKTSFGRTDKTQTKLYNVTDSKDVVFGDSNYFDSTNFVCGYVGGDTVFTVTKETTLEVRYYAQTNTDTGDLGSRANAGVDENFATVKITRKA